MSLMNGNEARASERAEKITAVCMLCPNRGVRVAMKPFGNGVLCDPCAAKVREARAAGFTHVLVDPYERRAEALGFSRLPPRPPVIEPLCVRQQKSGALKPFAEFVAMAFIIAVIFVAFVIAGE